MLLSLSLSTKPRDCLRFRAFASFRFFCSKRCVAWACLANPGIGGVCATVRGLLLLATSNFFGASGRAEKGRLMVFLWCFVWRGCCAGAVEGLCNEESFRGSRRRRRGHARERRVDGVSVGRADGVSAPRHR